VPLRIRCLAKEKWATFGGVRTSGLGKEASFCTQHSPVAVKTRQNSSLLVFYLKTNEYSSANNRRIWEQESAVEAFLRVFKSLTRIFIPVLKVLLVDLRRLAAQVIMYQLFRVDTFTVRELDSVQADRTLRQSGNAEDANKLEGAGRVMRKCLAQVNIIFCPFNL
jgi:hypothetical protein